MTMKVLTRGSGELEVDPDTVLTFPAGIPGFEECRRFKLFYDINRDVADRGSQGFYEPREEDVIRRVYWMQSLDDATVVFSVVVPSQFGVTFSFPLDDEEVSLLKLGEEDPEPVLILMILSKVLDKDPAGETAVLPSFRVSGTRVRPNLTGPLVLNMRERVGLQKVLGNIRYHLEVRGV